MTGFFKIILLLCLVFSGCTSLIYNVDHYRIYDIELTENNIIPNIGCRYLNWQTDGFKVFQVYPDGSVLAFHPDMIRTIYNKYGLLYQYDLYFNVICVMPLNKNIYNLDNQPLESGVYVYEGPYIYTNMENQVRRIQKFRQVERID